MKKIYVRLFLVTLMCFNFMACSIFEEPNPFDENETPFTTIIFKLTATGADDLNYTGTGTPSTPNGGSATLTTPFRATCNARVYAKLTGEATKVDVYRFNATNNTRELKTTLTPVNGMVFLDVPVSSLTLGGVAPTAGTVVLEFTAVAADGRTTTRRFTFTINNTTGPAC